MPDFVMTLTVPEAQAARVADAFDAAYSGRVTIDEETQEEIVHYTKAEWVKLQVIRYVRELVLGTEARLAREALELPEEVEIT